MTEYNKPFTDLSTLIPVNLRNEVNTALMSNLFNKNLTHEEVIKLYGLIGKYFPDSQEYRPWLSQINLDREINQLIPLMETKIGTDTLIRSFEDIVNKSGITGIDISNIDSYFKSLSFNFSLPINLDKFVNFSNYYWIQKNTNDKPIWNENQKPEYYVIDNLGASNWSKYNYWVHKNDLWKYNTTTAKIDQAVRPIIEYDLDLELIPGYEKSRFNQIPLFTTYYPFDNTKTPWASNIFSYVEDENGIYDPILQKKLKGTKIGNFYFSQGLIGPNDEILCYKKGQNYKTIWDVQNVDKITTIAVSDRTGSGLLTNINVKNTNQQTWTLTAVDTNVFSVHGSLFGDAGQVYADQFFSNSEIEFKLNQTKKSFIPGETIVIITGIQCSNSSNNENWILKYKNSTSFSVVGNKAGQLPDAIINTSYHSPFISFTLSEPVGGFSVTDTFKIYTTGYEQLRNVIKGSNGVPITSIQKEGVWLNPPQMIHNLELENRKEILYGDLVDHFSNIIYNQTGLVGNAYGTNNSRNIEINNDLGGNIKVLSGNSNLFLGLMNDDISIPALIDFANDQYANQLNSVSDFLITSLPQLLTNNSTIDLKYLFDEYEKDYAIKTKNINAFNLTTCDIKNWILTLPLLGLIDAVQPDVNYYDLELESFVLKHHDGHISPKVQDDKIFEYNFALTPVKRYDGTTTQGTVSAFAPIRPYKGQLWFNPSTQILKFFNVTFEGQTVPVNAELGNTWYDRVTDKYYLFVNNTWTEIASSLQWDEFNFADLNNHFIIYFEEKLYKQYLTQNIEGKSKKIDVDLYQDDLILMKEFAKFSVANGYEPYINAYDINNPFTWNYHLVDFSNYGISNYARWNIIYKNYFTQFTGGLELIRPDLEPWKLFGLAVEPTVWQYHYQYQPHYLNGKIETTLTIVSDVNVDINSVTSINNYQLLTGDSVLLMNQTNSIENGIYTFNGIKLVLGTNISTNEYIKIDKGLYKNSKWIFDGSQYHQIRLWNKTIWDDIRALHPTIKICVNPYTDELLAPFSPININTKLEIINHSANNLWTINHSTIKRPAIIVYRNNGIKIDSSAYVVQYMTDNQLTISFNDGFHYSGYVELFEQFSLLSDIPKGTKDDWSFGDEGPIEMIWRKYAGFNYAKTKCAFLKNPIAFLSSIWGFQDFYINHLQLDRITGKLLSHKDFFIHGDNISLAQLPILINFINGIISVPNNVEFKVFYQQNDGKMLLKNDEYNLVISEGNNIISNPLLGIVNLEFSFNFNGYPLVIGDSITISFNSHTIYVNSINRAKYFTCVGLNQIYSQYLKYYSVNIEFSKHRNSLTKWETKLGYRTSSFVENDSLQIISDIFGTIPNTAYNVILNKRSFSKDMWFHSLRVVVTKVGKNKSYLTADDGTMLYIPENKGEDWEFKIENYFNRNPEITYYEMDPNAGYETFFALTKEGSQDEWRHYLSPISIKQSVTPIRITGLQNLVTLLFGYSTYLEDEGFRFGYGDNPSTDNITGRIKNWQFEIEKMIDFFYKGVTESTGISLNPGLEKFALQTNIGLPSTFSTAKFGDAQIHSFMYDVIGDVIDKTGYKIIRKDEITEFFGAVPLLGAHIILDYYEHCIVFEDYLSPEGGLLFDPFLGMMTEKLLLKGKINNHINFRPTFGGFVLNNQHKFLSNMTKSVDDMSNYYDASKMFDNEVTSKNALALLGFSHKAYNDLLQIDKNTEFNFWRSMINAKGTNYSVDVLLNSVKFEHAQIDEFWAYKIAEYGDSRIKTYPELKLESSDCILKHTRLYFLENDLDTPINDGTFINILPDDESRWYSISDLNSNLFFEPEMHTVTLSVVANEYTSIPLFEEISFITDENGGIVNYTKINETIIVCETSGDFTIHGYVPAKPKHSPIKLIDYSAKEVLYDITTWHPAMGHHCSFGLENINITADLDPAKYNYSTIINDSESYNPNKIWGDREIGRIWWDTTGIEYVPYYDKILFPDFEERLARWGSLTEYSNINVYEWVKSDVDPSEYNKLALTEQLSADKKDKKSGQVAGQKTYKRNRDWFTRPIAWSFVSTPPIEQNVRQFISATSRLYLTSSSIGPTNVILEHGKFSQYGISNGMHLSAWLGNKPYGELELIGNEKYLIGSSSQTGGDIMTLSGDTVFDFIQVTWSNNKNFIGNCVGTIDLTVSMQGTESKHYLTATDKISNLSSSVEISNVTAIPGTFVEYDFNEIGIKLKCKLTQEFTAAYEIYDEFVTLQNAEFLDIVIRSYLSANVLIDMPKTILDNALPINLPAMYTSTLTVSGLSYFSNVSFVKNNTAVVGQYSIINSGNNLSLRYVGSNVPTITSVPVLDIDNTGANIIQEVTYNLGDITIIGEISVNFYNQYINNVDLINELEILGGSIVIGYDNATNDILIEYSNELILGEYGWKCWNIPTQDQLDNDLVYPNNSWVPVYGDFSLIPSNREIIDRIVSYNKSPLVLNTAESIVKYQSTWNTWQEIQDEKQELFGLGNKCIFTFNEEVKEEKIKLYINGILQSKNVYVINGKLVSTINSIPIGYKVVCIKSKYEPTKKELAFDPKVVDDSSIQEHYKQDYQYVIKPRRDDYGNIIGNDYYFWVKNKVTSINNRHSVQQIEKLLKEGPTVYMTFQKLVNGKYKGLTISGLNSVVLKDKAYKLRFTRDNTLRDDPLELDLKNVHSEWVLLRKNQNQKIPKELWDKLVDSATGQNARGDELPNIKLALYDERHGTQTRIGLGKDQVLANKDLVISSLKYVLKNPKSTIYKNGINTIVGISGIDITKLDVLFSSNSSIRKLMDFIWRTALPKQINELFFEVMEDALASNYEFSDMFKTSRLSAHSIVTVKKEEKLNDSNTYY